MIRLKPRVPKLNQRHPLARGLIGAWPFYEGGGDTFNDLTRARDNASALGGVTWTSSPFGSALSLNGSSQGVNIPYSATLDSAATTISFMFFPTATVASGNYTTLFSQGGNGTTVPRLFDCRTPLNTAGTTLCWGNYDGVTVTGVSTGLDLSVSANLNQWYLIVGTCDASGNCAVYLNGVLKGTATGMTLSSNTKEFNLGYLDNNGSNIRFFTGSIQNVRIWNRVLSASEVARDYFDPFAIYRRSEYRVGVAAAAQTIFWGYDPEPIFPTRRRAQRTLTSDDATWPITVTATPTQFGWDNPEQFAKRQIVRGLSRQDTDPTTVPITPPVTQFGWDNPEKFAIRSRRGTFQNQDDEFNFTAVPTPTQLSFPWEPQFPIRRRIDALQSPDDEFLLIPGTSTPKQQGFDWHPQFPVRRRFRTFQSPDDEFKFTAVATPTQFGWNIDPQFAERRKHRFLINPTDDEWPFTISKTPTQFGWHTDPQFAQRLRLLLKLWEEEGDGPFKPPAGSPVTIQHLLMLLGFGR